jgi:3-carboxy-cis,cis-muconate cycloisomerase
MLDFELALARALVRVDLAPESAADALAAVASDTSWLDFDELGRRTAEYGTPVPGLLSALRERLGEGDAASHLHRGATSQDVVDSASMLVARRALAPLLEALERAADSCAELADRHRATVMPGRTLLQQGAPISFGLKAAGWLSGLDEARAELARVRDNELALQLGGAVGTLAGFDGQAMSITEDVASQLALAVPTLPWHTVRTRPARLAAALATTLGALAKLALDVVLLAQTEIAEVREGGGEQHGGSSAMPHKRNPVNAVAILACAEQAPGLLATVVSAMVQEHERAAGSWQAEWPAVSRLLELAGSAATAVAELVTALEIDPQRMREDIVELGLSQQVVAALSQTIDGSKARRVVEDAARTSAERGRRFREVLLEAPEIRDQLGPDELDRALSPDDHLGAAGELIDRALAAHRG